ncbi:DUF7519 family protein [Natronomonas amylolytica]|uniref:DUF7519 family protein n=1 Tax=Natronomonas amylolytica TaxID=3108498 RepID=UPI0030094D02
MSSTSPLVEASRPTLRQRVAEALDDARHRLTAPRLSDAVAAAVAVVATALVGSLVLGETVLVGLGGGAAIAVALYLLNSDRTPVRFLGGIAVFVAGLACALTLEAAVGALETSPVAALVTLVATGATVAVGVAAPLAATRAPDRGRFLVATKRAVLALLGALALLAAFISPNLTLATTALDLAVGVGRSILGHLLASPPTYAVLTAPFVVLGATLGLLWAVRVVPIDALVPPSSRDAVVNALDGTERALGYLFLASFVWIIGVAGLVASVGTPRLQALLVAVPPNAARALALLALPAGLRVALLGLTTVAVGAGLLTRLLRRVRRMNAQWLARALAPTLGGAAVTAALGWYLSQGAGLATFRRGLRAVNNPAAEFLATLGPYRLAVALLLACGVVALLALFGFSVLTVLVLPNRLTGPALAAFGVFTCALVAALVGAALPALVGAVAAVVVWDANTFGRELRDQLPSGPSSARTELVHLAGSLAVGAVAVGVAVLVAGSVGTVAAPSATALVALLLAAGAGLTLLSVS